MRFDVGSLLGTTEERVCEKMQGAGGVVSVLMCMVGFTVWCEMTVQIG